MAVIHHTTLTPTKVELLTDWLPTRPWYRGGPGSPMLDKSGGFRLDDPEDEVGIEFMVVTDTSTPEPVTYLVPLTYRGAALEGAEHALAGTMEHGVLGKRWVYDGCHDGVLVTELLALIEGRVQAMAQSISDTPDHDVVRSYTGAPTSPDASTPGSAPDLALDPTPSFTPEPVDDQDGTRLPTPHGTILHVHRVLHPVPGQPPLAAEDAVGHVARGWQTPDGAQVAAVLMTLRTA